MTKRSIVAGILFASLALPHAATAVVSGPQASSPAQPPTSPRTTQTAPSAPPPAVHAVPFDDDRGARDTRERLKRLLEQYPPSVRQVLRIDTSLLSRPDYLATYPALATFLEQHPEVVHNPAYFVGDASGAYRGTEQPPDPKIEAIRAWKNAAALVPVVAIVFIITSALTGLIRTLLEQRRWQRAVRMQIEVHTKLIDRFSGNDELLAYVQSPAGRGLVDMQIQPLAAAAARSMDAPLGRIFWSLQSGIVLAAAGIGLLFVGARVTLDELSQPVSGIGILALTIGIGFVVSAGVSYLISQRLGLVTTLTQPDLHHDLPSR